MHWRQLVHAALRQAPGGSNTAKGQEGVASVRHCEGATLFNSDHKNNNNDNNAELGLVMVFTSEGEGETQPEPRRPTAPNTEATIDTLASARSKHLPRQHTNHASHPIVNERELARPSRPVGNVVRPNCPERLEQGQQLSQRDVPGNLGNKHPSVCRGRGRGRGWCRGGILP